MIIEVVRSHSQYGEDVKAWDILSRWECVGGRVLDIGAWHPTALSNSRLFIEAGWSAVLFEPSPAKLKDLVTEYGQNERVTVISAPVTVHGGFITLNITDDALSLEGPIPEQWKESGGFYGRMTALSVSVAELFAQFGGDFQLVSIDVEGTSVDVFAEMLNCGPRPRVVILEHDGRLVEVNQIAEAAHYRQAHVNGTNVIFEWTGRKES